MVCPRKFRNCTQVRHGEGSLRGVACNTAWVRQQRVAFGFRRPRTNSFEPSTKYRDFPGWRRPCRHRLCAPRALSQMPSIRLEGARVWSRHTWYVRRGAGKQRRSLPKQHLRLSYRTRGCGRRRGEDGRSRSHAISISRLHSEARIGAAIGPDSGKTQASLWFSPRRLFRGSRLSAAEDFEAAPTSKCR